MSNSVNDSSHNRYRYCWKLHFLSLRNTIAPKNVDNYYKIIEQQLKFFIFIIFLLISLKEKEKIQYEVVLVRKRVIGASLALWNGNKLSQWKQQVITLKKLNYPNARHNAWAAAPLKRTRASSCNRIFSSLRRLIEKHTSAKTCIREWGWKSAKRRKTLFVSHAIQFLARTIWQNVSRFHSWNAYIWNIIF